MPRPIGRIAIRVVANNPRRKQNGWPPRLFALYLIRRQAESGLLRDSGMTADEVRCYVQELRREVEQEVALRSRKRVR